MNCSSRIIMRLFICTGLLNNINAAVIFWDLGFTLVEPDKFAVARYVGMLPIAGAVTQFVTKHPGQLDFKKYMQNELYLATLAKIPSPSATPANAIKATVPDEIETPPLLRDVLAGTLSCADAVAHAARWAEDNLSFFTRAAFIKLVEFNFLPDQFAKKVVTCHPCAKLLAHYSSMRTSTGEKQHICLIVSNWAREWTAPFLETCGDTIGYFVDGYILSCDGYGLKPAAPIYQSCEQCVQKYFPNHVDEPWIYIDDQAEYFYAAQEHIHHHLICCTPDHAEQTLKEVLGTPQKHD